MGTGTKKSVVACASHCRKENEMWLGVRQHRGAMRRGCRHPHHWWWSRLLGRGTCRDTRALPRVLQDKARLAPQRGHTLLSGLLLPIRREDRGHHGHHLRGGSGGAPRTAAVSCSLLPGHPGPSQSSWDNSHLWEQSRHPEGLCPTTAVPQPRGAASMLHPGRLRASLSPLPRCKP